MCEAKPSDIERTNQPSSVFENDNETLYDGGAGDKLEKDVKGFVDKHTTSDANYGGNDKRCTFVVFRCHEETWEKPPCCFCFPFELGIRIHIWLLFLGIICWIIDIIRYIQYIAHIDIISIILMIINIVAALYCAKLGYDFIK